MEDLRAVLGGLGVHGAFEGRAAGCESPGGDVVLEELFVDDVYYGGDEGLDVLCAGCEGFDVTWWGLVGWGGWWGVGFGLLWPKSRKEWR